ncbi:TerB family tellurite resistance protein [Bauldia sp.]|uniref:tellurite resistance TerB family protein n=1 Tax=Bauldia sp. TaxID=2575872 RepID=UPI003BACA82A
MISALKQFLADLRGDAEPEPISEDRCRLAAAALLFHVIAIDGEVSEAEKAKLRSVLKERFELDDADVDELVVDAEKADKEAVDLYGFTSIVKSQFDEADRERIVEMMWQLAFADGKVHEFEDNLLWRVAELLGVSSQARIRLKHAVRGDAGA